MVSDIVQLSQLMFSLVGKKAELDRKYFDQFVQPAWEAFEGVHENYKARFKEWGQQLTDGSVTLRTVIDQIGHERIYTSDARSQLLNMVGQLPTARLKTKQSYVTEFVEAVADYFTERIDLEQRDLAGRYAYSVQERATVNVQQPPDDEAWFQIQGTVGPVQGTLSQQAFGTAREVLWGRVSAGDDVAPTEVLQVFHNIINHLQVQYNEVARAYFQLRAALLA